METSPLQSPVFQPALPPAAPLQGQVPEPLSPGDVYTVSSRETGTGLVFDPNPVVTLKDSTLRDGDDAKEAVPPQAYFKVTLDNLLPGDALDGKYVTTKNTKERARDPERRFEYDRSDDRFNEVMAYYHMDRSQARIQELGYTNINNRQVIVDAHGTTDDNSFYIPWENTITLGTGGVDDAEDADIIVHEYGHSIMHSQVPGMSSEGESRVIGEGFADYWSTTAYADRAGGFDKEVVGNWDATSYSKDNPPALRRIDSPLTYEDRNGDYYHDGAIWAATQWDLFNRLGKRLTDMIVLESHFFLSTKATMLEGALALAEADRALYGGAHLGEIADVLQKRKFIKSPDDLFPSSAKPEEVYQPSPLFTKNASAEEIASMFLKERAAHEPGTRDMRIARSGKGQGATCVHFQQYFRNIPVEGGESSVIVNGSNKAPSLFKDAGIPEKELQKLPAQAHISRESACEAASQELLPDGFLPVESASLVFHTPSGRNQDLELAWKVHIPVKSPPGDWNIYISAQDGSVLTKRNEIIID